MIVKNTSTAAFFRVLCRALISWRLFLLRAPSFEMLFVICLLKNDQPYV